MRRSLLPILPLALGLVFTSSCGRLLKGGQDAGAEDLGSEELTVEEQDSVNRGSGAVPLFQQMMVLADEFFDFDPTLDPLKDALENAAAIFARVQAQLGAGCGQVGLNGDTVSVSYGPPPGCTTITGNVISGGASASVSKTGSTQSVAFVFSQRKTKTVKLPSYGKCGV